MIPDENESNIVKMVYEEYASGKFSINKLAREIYEQGLRRSNGKVLLDGSLRNVLRYYKVYSGTDEHLHYPPIISKELGLKAFERLQLNITEASRASKNKYFANKIVKCKCGRYLMASAASSYQCSKKTNVNGVLRKIGCEEKTRYIKINVLDGILWRVAMDCHYQFMEDMTNGKREEICKRIKVCKSKINEFERRIEGFANQKKRIAKSFIMGMIEEDEIESIKASIDAEEKHLRNEINKLHENISSMHEKYLLDL